jgi:hypothetical protein
MKNLPYKKKVKKLEQQDKELKNLPRIEKEKKYFEKKEGKLKRLIKPQPIEIDLKKLAKDFKKKGK